ncbi:hypothetical protein F2Q69_00050344 [Brassica cretica]|uniref:Pentatricopeptide repeat-containing protein n=1 Tax=Brassica cretica TaxID=69181 RepID=A0A8S9PKT9_BRACR|nr:hypothetical protein F2Q69_00050344 [Brassica cretica]
MIIVLELALEFGDAYNVYSWNAIIAGALRNQDYGAAFDLFNEMQRPDSYTVFTWFTDAQHKEDAVNEIHGQVSCSCRCVHLVICFLSIDHLCHTLLPEPNGRTLKSRPLTSVSSSRNRSGLNSKGFIQFTGSLPISFTWT